MGIKFVCPNGHKLNVKDNLAGKKGLCPHCGSRFVIPNKDSDTPAAEISATGGADVAATVPPNEAGASSIRGTGLMPPVGPAARPPSQAALTAPAAPTATAAPATPAAPVIPAAPAAPIAPSLAVAAPITAAPLMTAPGMAVPSMAVPTMAVPTMAVPAMAPAMPAAPLMAAGRPDPILTAPNATWYMRLPSGDQYGPCAAPEMKSWLDQNRVPADALVWRDDWADWKRADETFPSLAAPTVGMPMPGAFPGAAPPGMAPAPPMGAFPMPGAPVAMAAPAAYPGAVPMPGAFPVGAAAPVAMAAPVGGAPMPDDPDSGEFFAQASGQPRRESTGGLTKPKGAGGAIALTVFLAVAAIGLGVLAFFMLNQEREFGPVIVRNPDIGIQFAMPASQNNAKTGEKVATPAGEAVPSTREVNALGYAFHATIYTFGMNQKNVDGLKNELIKFGGEHAARLIGATRTTEGRSLSLAGGSGREYTAEASGKKLRARVYLIRGFLCVFALSTGEEKDLKAGVIAKQFFEGIKPDGD